MFEYYLIFIVLVFGLLLLWLISKKRNLTTIERSKIQAKWHEIEDFMNEQRFKEAILEADKVFDYALKGMNIKGKTMGERLINAKALLNNYHDVWEAHKVRNRAVHEVDFDIDVRKATQVIRAFEKGIKNLKVM